MHMVLRAGAAATLVCMSVYDGANVFVAVVLQGIVTHIKTGLSPRFLTLSSEIMGASSMRPW